MDCQPNDPTKNTQYVDWVHTYKMEYKPGSVPVMGVSVSPDTIHIENRGEIRQLTPVISPVDETNQKVSWVSSDTKVVAVKQRGEIKAMSLGTATITYTTEDANKTGTCFVRVGPTTGLNTPKSSDRNKVNIYLIQLPEVVSIFRWMKYQKIIQ